MHRRLLLLVVLATMPQWAFAQAKAEFPLKDGDIWVMAGDSITAQHLHTNYFEAFCFARCPNLKFSFRNSGVGGHTIPTTLARFDYDIAAWEEGMLGKYPVYVLSLKAKNNEVSYPTLKLSVRTDKPLVLKEEDYSLSDRLMRTVLYPPKYIEVAGRTVYSQILIQDELNKGEKSQLTISDVSVANLPDATFSKAFLGQSSR
jgi:hypothetical protein